MCHADPARFARLAAMAVLALSGGSAHAQFVVGEPDHGLTFEAFVNSSAGFAGSAGDDTVALDGALRVLGIASFAGSTQLGARIVAEGATGDGRDIEFAERSVLLIKPWGRLEIGRRQGLPDVLTGYAPNNFTFTTAEFGPASGRSLDPAGGLVASFLDEDLAPRVARLATLGFAATLYDDRAEKLIYVSPKWRGLLAGASYARNAGRGNDAFGELLQLGLTHERYTGLHVIRYGGSYNEAEVPGARRLRSFNTGVSATLNDAWLLGLSATIESGGPGTDRARGIVASVNYNHGPWTYGGFLQWAETEADRAPDPQDRLRAGVLGVSYRSSQQLRWFAGYHRTRLDGGAGAGADRDFGVLVVGLRVAL